MNWIKHQEYQLNQKHQGFTLIELLVTIAVASIMLTIAIPAMTNFIQDGRLTAQTNEFISALRATRGEAIKRGQSIDLERKGGDWGSGWEIQNAANNVLKQWDGNASINLTAASANSIAFRPSGVRANVAAGDFVIKFCDARNKGRRITVSGLGGMPSVCWIGYPGVAEVCVPDTGCAAIP